jgi:hypothetical protein
MESGHGQVGNETTGMQTPKVAKAGSLIWSGARGNNLMVNTNESSIKLRYP